MSQATNSLRSHWCDRSASETRRQVAQIANDHGLVSPVIEKRPTDVAIWLQNATLTRVP
jgi:hypothetical protein